MSEGRIINVFYPVQKTSFIQKNMWTIYQYLKTKLVYSTVESYPNKYYGNIMKENNMFCTLQCVELVLKGVKCSLRIFFFIIFSTKNLQPEILMKLNLVSSDKISNIN